MRSRNSETKKQQKRNGKLQETSFTRKKVSQEESQKSETQQTSKRPGGRDMDKLNYTDF